MIKKILLKEKAKLIKKRELLESKINELNSDINDIDVYLSDKREPVKEPVNEEIIVEPLEQTIIICMYKETGENAPHMDNVLWYHVFQNPNVTSDLDALTKSNKVLVGLDGLTEEDNMFLKKIANHYNLEFLGADNGSN